MGKRRRRHAMLWPDAEAANEASVKEARGSGGFGAYDPFGWDEDDAACAALDAQANDYLSNGGYGSSYGSYGGNSVAYSKCEHNGRDPQIDLGDGLTISGGTGAFVNPDERTTLIVDLAGRVPTYQWVLRSPPNLAHLQHGRTMPPILRLDWYDQCAPDVDAEWFTKLYAAIRAEYAPGNVIIACVGGHGRTGTAMVALMLTALPNLGVADAVQTVWAEHCKKAVESKAQFKYLAAMRPDEELPEWFLKEMNPPPLPPPLPPLPSKSAAPPVGGAGFVSNVVSSFVGGGKWQRNGGGVIEKK